MMTKKILFLHGFFASGSCIPAQTLKQAFVGKAEVLTPDLPLHPKKALAFIENICQLRIGGQQQRGILSTDSGIPTRFACPVGQSLLRNDPLSYRAHWTARIQVTTGRQASTFHNRPIPHRGVCRGTSPPMGCLPTGTG